MNKHCYLLLTLMFFLICCITELYAQDTSQSAPEFPIGAFVYSDTAIVYDTLDASGMNYMVSGLDENTQYRPIKLLGVKGGEPDAYIAKYTQGYYTRWEAETDVVALQKTGIKHPVDAGGQNYIYGQVEDYLLATCWASDINVGNTVDSLIWGPNYKQDKKHRWYQLRGLPIRFNADFRLALRYAEQYPNTTPVCRLSVYYRYNRKIGEDTVYISITLNDTIIIAEDFNDSSFTEFTLDYIYPANLTETRSGKLPDYLYTEADTAFIDDIQRTGIEFGIDWFDVGKLYVDYVEVYDDAIWKDYIEEPNDVADLIRDYANEFTAWNSLEYWFAYEEPNTIDSYTPFRIIDSLIQHHPGINKRKPLATIIYEDWRGKVNGDWHLNKFVELAKPNRLMIDWFPFWADVPDPTEGFKFLRSMLKLADIAQPDFWYVPQGFGQSYGPGGSWCQWRKPLPEELNASIMLALAHGSKGILIWEFSSNWSADSVAACNNQLVYFDGLVSETGVPSELYDYAKDGLVPRLKSKLGKTLLTLDYTGNFLQLQYFTPTQNPVPPPVTYDYLTLGYGAPSEDDMNWHAGFLEQVNNPENKYFLLANLWTNSSRAVQVRVTEPVPGYVNYRFRNVEPGYNFDYTFNDEIIATLDHPAGEGYLYQVAPVVKYGGRLIYNETVADGTTLLDDMIIENGATLTIYETYNAEANIIVKDGSIVNGENGKVIFKNGFKLIVEGSARINGTAQNKLEINFSAPMSANGILVDSLGSLDIEYCTIKNAEIGISVEPYYNHIDIDSVDFEDCSDYSISISGPTSSGGDAGIPYIQNSTIENSEYGIIGVNLAEIIVKDNTITDTDLGIDFSNISKSTVLSNVITSENEELPGILFVSSSGEIRANIIEGHTNGIQLGNSSPDIGSNRITENLFHGIYIGAGSLPNMDGGSWIGNPPVFYATSGYNDIYDNGGYNVGGGDDDGSEIYISNANVKMKGGCNSIYDDREPSPPLEDTELLMNGFSFFPIIINAEYNFWGDTVYAARFGNLIVDFEPYYPDPCPIPQGGGGDGLLVMSSGGEVIDTLYPVEGAVPELTATELLYAEAEEYFVTADYPSAEVLYQEIINIQATEEEKYKAQIRKYEIGRLTNQSPEFFNTIGNTFESIGANAADSLVKKIFGQLSTLCLIGEEEYIPAISEFDVIVQQNPGSEESVYAEIDALTTALLLPPDSTLGKGTLGKYLIKNSRDYFSKIDEILRKNFGSVEETEEKEIIPEEYTLYQNYPNPFNPVTTIKYDLPKAGEVELVVYDILGRKVKTLVNQTQQAGRYDIQFDASSLASGVYIYQLRTKDFVNSKKMILLK